MIIVMLTISTLHQQLQYTVNLRIYSNYQSMDLSSILGLLLMLDLIQVLIVLVNLEEMMKHLYQMQPIQE